MNRDLQRRLDALEVAQRERTQRQVNAAAAAANDAAVHWSERREWQRVLNLFRLGSLYNELPAYVAPDGRIALPTPTYPAHWPDSMRSGHRDNQAFIDSLNDFRAAGGVLILLTLSEVERGRTYAAKGWYPFTQEQVISYTRIVPHAEWGPFIQYALDMRTAIGAYTAQTGERIDTMMALIEWLESVWHDWNEI